MSTVPAVNEKARANTQSTPYIRTGSTQISRMLLCTESHKKLPKQARYKIVIFIISMRMAYDMYELRQLR